MKRTILLFFIFIVQLSIAQVFDVETILSSGSNESRINIVILGDGYQESELTQFISDANNFTSSLFSQSPYQEYQNYFNVHAVKVPSNESGASHPGTATDVAEPMHPVVEVDNYFGSTFDAFNIHRLLVATNTFAINSVLANNFPTYDQVIILVNSPHYGGSGGQFAVSSLNVNANEIAIHELGHSFVSLKDEYYAGDIYASEGINMTQETDPNNVRWENWIDVNEVGVYQHCCGGNASNWYRPHQGCKMRILGTPFCAVCVEGTIEKIHTIISPVVSFTPDNNDEIEFSSSTSFEVDVIEPIPNTLEIKWLLNGVEMLNNSSSVIITKNDLIPGDNQLEMKVEDATSLLKVDNHDALHNTSIQWNIKFTSLNLKSFLQGPFDETTGLMEDNLRENGLLPLEEPYGELGYNVPSTSTNLIVLGQTGNNAIVDWVYVELRSAEDPTEVIASQSALIQRDGNIVAADGSKLSIRTQGESDVFVVLRHRNHFGIRTEETFSTDGEIEIDFTDPSLALFGSNPMINMGGINVQFSGDANMDGQINSIDKNNFWKMQNGTSYEYLISNSDFNIDGIVNAIDKNNLWRLNNSRLEQLD